MTEQCDRTVLGPLWVWLVLGDAPPPQVVAAGALIVVVTTLHSVAVGNLLPATVKVVCVDINPSTVIKLNDRGSFQTVGLVTDVEPFLRALVAEIERVAAP